MPENETPEMKSERWLATIKPYLDELSQPKPDYAFLAKARAKNPFLDWVMSGKDPVAYFAPAPASPPAVPLPWEQESPGMPANPSSQPQWFDRYGEMI